jgi:hypothetical protein
VQRSVRRARDTALVEVDDTASGSDDGHSEKLQKSSLAVLSYLCLTTH